MIDGVLTHLRAFKEFSATKNKCMFLVFLVKDDDLEDLNKRDDFMDEIIGVYYIKKINNSKMEEHLRFFWDLGWKAWW